MPRLHGVWHDRAEAAVMAVGVALLLGGSYLGALALRAEEDAFEARLSDALVEGYEDHREGTVDLAEVLGGEGSALYVFGPLTPRRTIAAKLAAFAHADEAIQGEIDSSEARVVLVEDDMVQVAVTLDRQPIDLSCATAPGMPIDHADHLRVIRVKRSGLAPLAATVRDRRTTRRCLAQLPSPHLELTATDARGGAPKEGRRVEAP